MEGSPTSLEITEHQARAHRTTAFHNQVPPLLSAGRQMAARIRDDDWSSSPLGRPGTWPPWLSSTVSLMLGSRFPMFAAFGPDLGFLYNDAYAETNGFRGVAVQPPVAGIVLGLPADITARDDLRRLPRAVNEHRASASAARSRLVPSWPRWQRLPFPDHEDRRRKPSEMSRCRGVPDRPDRQGRCRREAGDIERSSFVLR